MKSLETETNGEETDADRAILLYNKAVYCFYVCTFLGLFLYVVQNNSLGLSLSISSIFTRNEYSNYLK